MSLCKPKAERSNCQVYLRPFPYIQRSRLKAVLVFICMKKVQQDLGVHTNVSFFAERFPGAAPVHVSQMTPSSNSGLFCGSVIKITVLSLSLPLAPSLLLCLRIDLVSAVRRPSKTLDRLVALTFSPYHTNILVIWPWMNYLTLWALSSSSANGANPLFGEAGGYREMENGLLLVQCLLTIDT